MLIGNYIMVILLQKLLWLEREIVTNDVVVIAISISML